MSKFRIKFKLQGLELEVEGVREDLPVIRQALSDQIAGALNPATDIADGEVKNVTPGGALVAGGNGAAVSRSKRKPRAAGAAAPTGGEKAFDWRHEPEKYGSPLQSWSLAKKAQWLLYVVATVEPGRELTAGEVFATFNKHFKQAGLINRGNTTRDLGKMKSPTKDTPALVVEDTTKTPPKWSLTEAGKKAAQALVAEAMGAAKGA